MIQKYYIKKTRRLYNTRDKYMNYIQRKNIPVQLVQLMTYSYSNNNFNRTLRSRQSRGNFTLPLCFKIQDSKGIAVEQQRLLLFVIFL